MQKISLLFALFFTLVFASCDSTSGDPAAAMPDDSAVVMTDNQKAAVALKLMSDGLQNSTADAVITKADIALPELDLSKLTGEVYNQDGMKIDAAPVVDLGSTGLTAGVRLTFTLTDYALKVTDPSTSKETDLGTVSGVMELVIGFEQEILSSSIVVIANTPADKQLVFKGGQVDGTKIGFNNLKISIDASSITGGISLGGSPVVVEGTVIVNDTQVYVNSEILELLMGMI